MRQDVTSPEAVLARGTIRAAHSAADVERARKLFLEYASWLKVDLCFQDFERELSTLPGAYAPPHGRLLLAGEGDDAFGCIALRPLEGACGCAPAAGAPDARRDSSRKASGTGEVKRLYVQPGRRSQGWGERLARALLAEARVIGYRELKLDTLAWMNEARALYGRLGFRECAPYYDNPLDGAVYMSLALSSGSEKRP
jgi:ribosomal protein S18 acetylase RimI-like enzyme